MPSAKILESKKALVKDLNEKIAGSLAGVVVAYNGISVADDTKLRKELREAGVHYMVVKNTMLRLAVKGTQYEGLTDYFKGDTAIALSPDDPAAAARILCKFADADKSKRFVVKGGFCDGQVMDAAGIKSLSTWPLPCRVSSTSRTRLLPDFRHSCLSAQAQRSNTNRAA